jgi:phage terminase large subunit-like protein
MITDQKQLLTDEDRAKIEALRLYEAKKLHQDKLPHLYAHKFYTWQRDFFETTNPMAFLTAANQIGKSTIQIKKVIHLATHPEAWPVFWPGRKPNLFWYLYPSKELATIEWETKWRPLMPQGDYGEDSDHPQYGWKRPVMKNNLIDRVQFNSGVLLVFKVYEQKTENLQANSVFYIACDEELPYEHYQELGARTQAVDGYFSMVFTATLGQEQWRLTMEPKTNETEMFPAAFKRQVSLYDCMFYEDGSPGQYDVAKINRAIARCGTEAEIQRRVYGKFVVSGGRRYEAFESAKNAGPAKKIPSDWIRLAGIDSGSGGEPEEGKTAGDPAAIVFLAVSPDFKQGVVYRAWRGDKQLTTSGDIIEKFLELKGAEPIDAVVYDYSDKDLQTLATRLGLSFIKAEKGRDFGDGILNTLFKNRMLYLFSEGDVLQLASELSVLKKGQKKGMDHLSDALRYVCAYVAWNLEHITGVKPKTEPKPPTQDEIRRGRGIRDEGPREQTLDQEFEEWQSYLDG